MVRVRGFGMAEIEADSERLDDCIMAVLTIVVGAQAARMAVGKKNEEFSRRGWTVKSV